MRIDQAFGQIKSLDVAFPEDTLHVTYKPMEFTPAELEVITAAEVEERPRQLVELFLRCVQTWDLTDLDDAPVPLEYEVLHQKVPVSLLSKVFTEIQKASAPDPKA